MGIDNSLLSWICDYLTNMRQRCIVSRWLPVTSGVLQRNYNLGPLLLLLYIINISDNLTCNVVLFVGDCILFREVQTKGDQLELQND